MITLSDRINAFGYRLSLMYPDKKVELGYHVFRDLEKSFFHFPLVVIVDDLSYVAETIIVLKHMKLFNDSYIIPHKMVSDLDVALNNKLLREFVDIINPTLTVVAGDCAVSALKNDGNNGRISIGKQHGRSFQSNILNREFILVYPANMHVGPDCSRQRKSAAKADWEKISFMLDKLKKKCIMDSWCVNQDEASAIIKQSQGTI